MPCDSRGYELDNRNWENFCKKTARCFIFLAEKVNAQVPDCVRSILKCRYPSEKELDKLVAALCTLCRTTPEDVIYDGRDAKMRKVADWWDRHKKLDKLREKREERERNRKKLKEQALLKLTKEEIKALGL